MAWAPVDRLCFPWIGCGRQNFEGGVESGLTHLSIRNFFFPGAFPYERSVFSYGTQVKLFFTWVPFREWAFF